MNQSQVIDFSTELKQTDFQNSWSPTSIKDLLGELVSFFYQKKSWYRSMMNIISQLKDLPLELNEKFLKSCAPTL